MKLNTLTLKQAITMLQKKEISLEDVYRDTFEVIEKQNRKLNIYLSLDKNAAAKAISERSTPLSGIPVAVKDNFLTVGLPTTASAKVLDGFMPPYESTVTKRLKGAGGIVIGKTNMDAWAHGSSTETSDWGTTRNPNNPDYSPGGSSGGSAAAIAADMCIIALGSETAGSIRVPANWCGCVGLKPTYGRVSRAGVVAMGSSLDSPGPLGKTVEDCALMLNVIAGKDEYDATSSTEPIPDYTKILAKGIKEYRIGICYMDHPQLRETEVDGAVTKAGKLFESMGAHVDIIPLSDQLKPNTILSPDYAIGVYTVVQRSEVSSNLARYDGIRYGHDRSTFAAEAKRRIMLGTFTLSKGYADKYYVRAQQARALYVQNNRQLFEKYDVLLSTPTPGYALKVGASADNPMFGELVDLLNEPSSLTGLPAISVPCYHDQKTNLDLGLSIIGNHWQEEKILRVAYAYEQNTKWNRWINRRIDK